MQYRHLWQRLLSLYDEREARAVVRLLLEERFDMTLADILGGALDSLDVQQREELHTMLSRLESPFNMYWARRGSVAADSMWSPGC